MVLLPPKVNKGVLFDVLLFTTLLKLVLLVTVVVLIGNNVPGD